MVDRVIIMVLDGFGVGEAPDANKYGDEGSNTLAGIYNITSLNVPNMAKLGLYNIDGVKVGEKQEKTIGAYGKAQEQAAHLISFPSSTAFQMHKMKPACQSPLLKTSYIPQLSRKAGIFCNVI